MIATLTDCRAAASGRRGGHEEPEYVHILIARVREGDKEALGELYSRYAQSVFACAYRVLQDSYEAEDVTQHVFIKLMRVLPQYKRREVPFSAWLMRVARNVALDAERKRRPVHCDDELPNSEAREEDDRERGQFLREALAALPSAQRDVVVLRHVIGLSATEVADRLGKTTGSIHALDQRGRRALKGDLIAFGSAPATLGATSRARLAAAA